MLQSIDTSSRKHAPLITCRPQVGRRSCRVVSSVVALRSAFTLLELMVTMVLLIVIMITVSLIFNVSSDTAAATAADAEVLAASAVFRETVTDQILKMAPGLLVIESPAPTSTRSEIRGGPRFLRLRHDRLVFMTQGDIDEYQSFTDPTRGDPLMPDRQTARSAQALVYFGPGIPLSRRALPVSPRPLNDDTDPLSRTLAASQWVFLHRSILLMLEPSVNTDPSWVPPTMDDLIGPGGMLNGSPLRTDFQQGTMDAVVSSSTRRANVTTLSNFFLENALDNTDLLSANPSIAALWEPSLAPRTVTLNPLNADFYRRSGSNFIPHLADFRIEWTDGRSIDPLGPDGSPNTGDEDLRTRWFGLRPDPAFDVSNAVLDNIETTLIPNVATRRQDFPGDTRLDEANVFGMTTGSTNKVEWVNATGSSVDNAYRALWRADTWDYRPKALRFTYRIYDEANRLKHTAEIDLDEDGDFDPDDSPNDVQRRVITRYGRTFTIVVNLP